MEEEVKVRREMWEETQFAEEGEMVKERLWKWKGTRKGQKAEAQLEEAPPTHQGQ